MKESRVWKYLSAHLPPYIQAERFEVIHPPGMSDVLWTDTRTSISGWLELKICEPDDRKLARGLLPKLKPEQPMFLRRQAAKGMPSGILLRVTGDDWYFFRARNDYLWVQRIREEGLIWADAVWREDSFNTEELFRALGRPCDVTP